MDNYIKELVEENKELNKSIAKLKAENKKLKKDFEALIESQPNVIRHFEKSFMLDEYTTYVLLNPTEDVNETILKYLSGKGIHITIPYISSNKKVVIDGVPFYTNVYCEDARATLNHLNSEIEHHKKALECLKAERNWLTQETTEAAQAKVLERKESYTEKLRKLFKAK